MQKYLVYDETPALERYSWVDELDKVIMPFISKLTFMRLRLMGKITKTGQIYLPLVWKKNRKLRLNA